MSNEMILKSDNNYTGEIILRNETGIFLCDENGKLLSYYPSIEVLTDEAVVRERYTYGDSYYKPCIKTMIVPEGVTSFCRDFFRWGMIAGDLVLPSTLKRIGSYGLTYKEDDCVFANTSIGRIVLPDTIESIGIFAFGNSCIGELVYPNKIIESQYARQFKGAIINRLLIPQNVFDYLQAQSRSPEHLLNYGPNKISDCIVY